MSCSSSLLGSRYRGFMPQRMRYRDVKVHGLAVLSDSQHVGSAPPSEFKTSGLAKSWIPAHLLAMALRSYSLNN